MKIKNIFNFILFALVLCLILIATITVDASSNISLEKNSLDEIEQLLDPYIERSAESGTQFNTQKAKEDNLKKEFIEIGLKINEINDNNQYLTEIMEKDFNDGNNSNEILKQNGIPIYGNWCGPWYGSGTPKDRLDRACMNHDKCYGRRGYFACSCDRELINTINANFRYMKVTEKAAAIAVRTWFKNAPCNPLK